MVYQLVSLTGAILILVAYGAQHMRRLHAETRTYLALNLAGGICLCIAAVAARQYGFILLEGAWTLISGWGLLRAMKTA